MSESLHNLHGQSVVLLDCYDSKFIAKNLQASFSLIYEACETYNLKVANSLCNAIGDKSSLKYIAEAIQKQYYTQGRKVIVITNDYKLLENNSSQKSQFGTLIAKDIVDLYQAHRKVILTLPDDKPPLIIWES